MTLTKILRNNIKKILGIIFLTIGVFVMVNFIVDYRFNCQFKDYYKGTYKGDFIDIFPNWQI